MTVQYHVEVEDSVKDIVIEFEDGGVERLLTDRELKRARVIDVVPSDSEDIVFYGDLCEKLIGHWCSGLVLIGVGETPTEQLKLVRADREIDEPLERVWLIAETFSNPDGTDTVIWKSWSKDGVRAFSDIR